MLSVKNIKKEYITGNLRQKALDDVSLNLRDSEFVAILGPSGSGKTTLLNIIGGLDTYDSGDLIIDGVSTKEYNDRKWDTYRNHSVGFIFQSYNLIAHQSILANVELALTISGISGTDKKNRALKALETVGLKEHAYKRPNQLSGGQMQRVAIARALVNNPSIILADEPTGALDQNTGIQVMELLKEVAKDRLVVMVTHNPDLAFEYANRIVEVKDGKIISDSNPYEDEVKLEKEIKVNYSSMSFKTAIKLSFNNLKSKKARTILTAFAGSIGIIGIALILSISSGVNEYIRSVETSTMSEYPLEITKTGVNIAMEDLNNDLSDSEVKVANMVSMMFSTVAANDIKSFNDYLTNNDNVVNNIKAIEYDYNLEPNIYTEYKGKIRQVHPDKSFNSLGIGSNMTSNSMISSMMSTDVFYALPKNEELYLNNYEVLEGKWPSNKNEAVLVLSKNHAMPDLLLYHLGLKPYEELDEAIKNFTENDGTKIGKYDKNIYYKDLIGISYRVINPTDLYIKDKNYDLYVDKSQNNQFLKEKYQDGEELKIVGVVALKNNSDFAMLKSGIAYHNDLLIDEIEKADQSEIVQEQLAKPEIDVLSGKAFNKNKQSLDLKELFVIDEEKVASAFGIDKTKLNVNLDLSKLELDLTKLVLPDFKNLFKDLNLNFDSEDISGINDRIIKSYNDFISIYPESTLKDFLSSSSFKTVLKEEIGSLLKDKGLDEKWFNDFEEIIKDNIKLNRELLSIQINDYLIEEFKKLGASFDDAFYFNADLFTQGISFKLNSEELSELLISSMGDNTNTYETNLKKFGYRDISNPDNLSIYPIDFESKQVITDEIDKYNDKMAVEDETKVISYIDYVKTLMNSVTSIVDVVSWVLIAFVAISLIVSSIMIGVITYISVLERKKEIGILRAIGASKRNIANVFNAETMMIGLLSGLIGIGVTLILLIPINKVISDIAGDIVVRAYLPIEGAIILIIISVILTLIGGLIPSAKASKENPVLALRSE